MPLYLIRNVNAGSHAVKVLQRTLILFDMEITVDGVIGPITIAETQTAARRAPDHLVDAYGIERVNYYLLLADARPSLRKFARTRRGAKGGKIHATTLSPKPICISTKDSSMGLIDN